MAFMNLYTEFGRWLLVEGRQGTDILPAHLVGIECEVGQTIDKDDVEPDVWADIVSALKDYTENRPRDIESVECVECWGARYSAPGYMDCTDWVLGDTEEEVTKDAREMYGSEDDDENDDEDE